MTRPISAVGAAPSRQRRRWRWAARTGVVLAIALPLFAASSGAAATTVGSAPAAPPPITTPTWPPSGP